MGKAKKRQSNLELLRIISMFLIIIHHFSVHGIWPDAIILGSKIVLDILAIGGKVGVNCFILITGYFMIKSHFKVRSILRVILETFAYSVVILAIFFIFDKDAVTMKQVIKSFLPITFGAYWFLTAYVGLYLFSPFINKMYQGFSKGAMKNLLVLSFVLFSVMPTFTSASFVTSNLAWFVFLYLLAGHIQTEKIIVANKTAALLAGGGLLFILVTIFVFDCAGTYISILQKHAIYFEAMNRIPTLAFSLGLFLLFRNANIEYVAAVNTVATTVFGIYLIHSNLFVRPWLWKHFSFVYDLNPLLIILVAIATAVCLFTMGAVIDLSRQKFIEKPLFSFLEQKIGNKFDAVDTWFNQG